MVSKRFIIGGAIIATASCAFIFLPYQGAGLANRPDTSQHQQPPSKLLPLELGTSLGNEESALLASNSMNRQAGTQTKRIRECERKEGNRDSGQSDYVQDAFESSDALLSLFEHTPTSREQQIAQALTPPPEHMERPPEQKQPDINEQISQLIALSQMYPEDPLISYDLMALCSAPDAQCAPSIIAQGIDLDSENGAVWLLSSLYELKNDNLSAATESLLQAAYTSIYDEYLGEHYDLFETALFQTGAPNELPTQLTVIHQMYRAPSPSYGQLAEFCQNAEPSQYDVLHACLSLGERLTQGNSETTAISQLVGVGLQTDIQRRNNNQQRLDELSAMKEDMLDNLQSLDSAFQITFRNRQRLSDWRDELKNNGEVAASEHVVKEAEHLSAQPEFDPCEVSW